MKSAIKFALPGLLFFIFCADFTATAQRLYFCKSVSEDGDPIGLNQFFYIPEGGTNIAALLKLPNHVDATEIELKFFNVDQQGNETFLSSVTFDVEKSWTWFWKSVDFHDQARYKVYAYADKDRLLCTETVDTYFQQ